MTAQTQSQRNASYRQRQREKIARMEGALREIVSLEEHTLHTGYDHQGNFIWSDVILLDDVKRIVKKAL